ncbi:MAG: antitoxin [Deltaproteobacteria bacterium]|nr:antitoxin [Deltaproteobacteria bacterium]
MNSKLTLRLEEDLIKSAKSYSAKTGKSVSKIVADYFTLIDKKLPGKQKEISPLTRSLMGSLKKGKISEEDYKKYLEEKYL